MSDLKNTYMLGKLTIFKNDDEYEPQRNELFDITDVRLDGRVEIAFDGPKGLRYYIQLPLGELVAKAAVLHIEDKNED